MRDREIYQTLATVSTYHDTLNTIAAKEMPVKRVCDISANSIKAWGVVMNEFNEVITALDGAEMAEDRIYRAAFGKALEIVMRANNFRKENGRKVC